jgi:hypothetical protein
MPHSLARRRAGKILSITAYLRQAGEALFSVRSGWKLTGATGAALESHERNLYRMVLQTPPGGMLSSDGSYAKVSAELRFAKR